MREQSLEWRQLNRLMIVVILNAYIAGFQKVCLGLCKGWQIRSPMGGNPGTPRKSPAHARRSTAKILYYFKKCSGGQLVVAFFALSDHSNL